MKYIFSILFVAAGLTGLSQETELDPENGPILTFAEEIFDFGNISQGDIVEHVFVFTNTGNAPLVISNAKGSCGCTVPNYARETAIAPGESSEMTVRFNSRGKSGNQIKSVTVYSNAQNNPARIRIKASIQVPVTEDEDSEG